LIIKLLSALEFCLTESTKLSFAKGGEGLVFVLDSQTSLPTVNACELLDWGKE
jgi:hypothetical protein